MFGYNKTFNAITYFPNNPLIRAGSWRQQLMRYVREPDAITAALRVTTRIRWFDSTVLAANG
jgi:hypothetical protein